VPDTCPPRPDQPAPRRPAAVGPRPRPGRVLAAVAFATTLLTGACRGDGAAPAATTLAGQASGSTTTTTVLVDPQRPRTATGANGNARDERIGPPANGRPSDGSIGEGSCFVEYLEAKGDALLHRMQTAACSIPHDGEVFAVVTVPGDPGAPFPGETEMVKRSQASCLARFEPFVGIEYATSALRIAVLRPTATTWAAGDRTVVCSVYDENLDPLVGSVRLTGR
jgi:hypothetical protein